MVEMTFPGAGCPGAGPWAGLQVAEMSKGQTMAALVAEQGSPPPPATVSKMGTREVLEDGNLFAGERITEKFTWLIHAD